MNKYLIYPSKRYTQLANGAKLANQRFNNIVKNQFAKKTKPKIEPIEFPNKYTQRVEIKKEIFLDRPVYELIPKGYKYSNKAIIFIHGGGGMMVPTSFHFEYAVKLVEESQIPLFFVMYPLFPKANAIKSYNWLNDYYQSLIKRKNFDSYYLIGDSAGANLSMALGNKVDKVEGVILISPACGLKKVNQIMPPYESEDLLLSLSFINTILESWGKDVERNDYRLNPDYVDYHNFPKTLMVYGRKEMFYAAIPQLINKMNKDNLTIYEGIDHFHDWPLLLFLNESKFLFERIVEFIKD